MCNFHSSVAVPVLNSLLQQLSPKSFPITSFNLPATHLCICCQTNYAGTAGRKGHNQPAFVLFRLFIGSFGVWQILNNNAGCHSNYLKAGGSIRCKQWIIRWEFITNRSIFQTANGYLLRGVDLFWNAECNIFSEDSIIALFLDHFPIAIVIPIDVDGIDPKKRYLPLSASFSDGFSYSDLWIARDAIANKDDINIGVLDVLQGSGQTAGDKSGP